MLPGHLLGRVARLLVGRSYRSHVHEVGMKANCFIKEGTRVFVRCVVIMVKGFLRYSLYV